MYDIVINFSRCKFFLPKDDDQRYGGGVNHDVLEKIEKNK